MRLYLGESLKHGIPCRVESGINFYILHLRNRGIAAGKDAVSSSFPCPLFTCDDIGAVQRERPKGLCFYEILI